MKIHKIILLISVFVVFIICGILTHSRLSLSWEDNERLLAAVRNNNIEAIAKLAHHLDEFDEFGKFGDTPIHEAARYGQFRSLEYLLSKGVNVNARDARQQTPLHVAIRNVTAHRSNGHVTLGGEPRSENMAVIQLLLDRGADLQAIDKDGRNPRDWATSLDLPMITAMLESHRPIK